MSEPKFSAIYYSHNEGNPAVLRRCWEQLTKAARDAGGEVIAVTREQMECPPADHQIIDPMPERNHVSIYRAILHGIAAAKTGCIFLCEHDVLYPAQHFSELMSLTNGAVIAHSSNVWHLSAHGFFKSTWPRAFLSAIMADSGVLQAAIKAKLAEVAAGTLVHAEPDSQAVAVSVPLVDIRHDSNLTGPREASTYFQELAPWGKASDYAFMFAGETVLRIPGMSVPDGVASPAPSIPRPLAPSPPAVRIAVCCEGRPGHWIIGIGETWYLAVSVEVARQGKQITHKQQAVMIHRCPFCPPEDSGLLGPETPTRKYRAGNPQLDKIVEALCRNA